MIDLYFFRFYVAVAMVGISVISIFILWVVGFSITKLTCKNESFTTNYDRFFLGWVVTVFFCWHAFSFGFSIKPILIGITVIPLIIALKYGNFTELGKVIRVIFGLVVIELVVGYFFYLELRPEWLSFVRSGNNDIYNYANHTIIALSKSPSAANNYLGTDLIAAIRGDVFGAMVWLGLHSVIGELWGPPIEVTMSAALSACSIYGLLLYHIVRRSFSLSIPQSIICLLFSITNGVFIYIVSEYFLAQILSFSIVLGIVDSTLSYLHSKREISIRLFLWKFIPYYFLILMVYPYIFVSTLFLHLFFMILIFHKDKLKNMQQILFLCKFSIIFTLGLILCLVILTPSRVLIAFDLVNGQVAGIRLANYVISMPMLFGIPLRGGVFSEKVFQNYFFLIIVIICNFFIAFKFFKSKKELFSMILVWQASLVVCGLAFMWFGKSYQSFKFATYYPLMLNFLLPAAMFVVIRNFKAYFFQRVLFFLCAALIIINFKIFQHYQGKGVSYEMADLVKINKISSFDRVMLDELPFGEVMLVRQYITNKYIQPTSPSYYNFVKKPLNTIPEKSAILSKNSSLYSLEKPLDIGGGFYLYSNFNK